MSAFTAAKLIDMLGLVKKKQRRVSELVELTGAHRATLGRWLRLAEEEGLIAAKYERFDLEDGRRCHGIVARWLP